jgi:hypothetical protein
VLSTADGMEIQHIASDPRCDIDDVEFNEDEETVEAVCFDYDRYHISLMHSSYVCVWCTYTHIIMSVCMCVVYMSMSLMNSCVCVWCT